MRGEIKELKDKLAAVEDKIKTNGADGDSKEKKLQDEIKSLEAKLEKSQSEVTVTSKIVSDLKKEKAAT